MCRLAHPVRHDARRRDHQKRTDVRVADAGMADERERLQRLPEAHVVGQNPAELQVPERGEPAEPVALVGAQLCGQHGRRHMLGERLELEQRSDLTLPPLCLRGHDAQRSKLGPESGLVATDPQRCRRRVCECAGLLDQLAQGLQARIEQREVGAVLEQHVRLAARERHEDLGERQLATFDADRHTEVEPVALSGDLSGGDSDRQRLADVAVVRRLALDLDGHSGQLA